MNRAAAEEIVNQANALGINCSRLEDLSDAEYDELMSHYQFSDQQNTDIIEESVNFSAGEPSHELLAED